MASVAELEAKSSNLIKKTIDWVALIYLPGNEIQLNNSDYLINGNQNKPLIPFYRPFQYIDPDTNEYLSIIVHPGTNIGFHVRNNVDGTEVIRKLPKKVFDAIFNNPLNKIYLANNSIIPVYPLEEFSELSDEQPGYRHFSDDEAILLLNHHTHEKWVDQALIGETRAVVKTTAEARKNVILQNRLKAQEGY